MSDTCPLCQSAGGSLLWSQAGWRVVRVDDCEVTLEGSVRDRREKRLAEDVAERVAGVRDVHNLLRVKREATARDGGEQPEQPRRPEEPGRPFRAA